jgi:hypothetical protein
MNKDESRERSPKPAKRRRKMLLVAVALASGATLACSSPSYGVNDGGVMSDASDGGSD